jgi:L-lactate permease
MDAAEIRRRKRRSNRAVFVGVCQMALGLLCSAKGLGPQLASTVAAVIGLVFLVYGVHVGWLVFYDRDPDGPSS